MNRSYSAVVGAFIFCDWQVTFVILDGAHYFLNKMGLMNNDRL